MTKERNATVPAPDTSDRSQQQISRTPASAPVASELRKPMPGELPDDALDGATGGARISKTELLRL